ncbi:MAG TPA: hypothetical protein VLE73_05505 [Candidatus Saccharimonadales bacterium]|nr:hypothetical protein [Candidatus Saccharimonadales bacterium]
MSEQLCFNAGICAFGSPGAPECGTEDRHFLPLPTAEELCPNALAQRVEYERSNPYDLPQPVRDTRHAWALTEHARALPCGDPLAEDCFDDARLLVNRAVDGAAATGANGDRTINATQYVEATLLDAYLPAFHAMHASKRLGPERSNLRRARIANLIDVVNGADYNENVRRGKRIKVGLHLLLGRSPLTIFPSSPREGQNRLDPTNNHDVWALEAGNKVPIKMRGLSRHTREYSPKVLFLGAKALVCTSYRRAYWTEVPTGTEAVDTVIHLLHQEALGKQLGSREKRWLDAMTNAVVQQVHAFAAARQALGVVERSAY